MTLLDSERIKFINQNTADCYGKRYSCFVDSGMAAIELALECVGAGDRDEVIVPDNVCPAVVDAIIRVNCRPVFVGTDLSLIPTVTDVKHLIRGRTIAVICVHLFGLPFAIAELRSEISSSIAIIEDAAQAFGSINSDWKIGQHSNIVVTSFGATKPVSLGGGGALFGNDSQIPDLVHRVRESEVSRLAANRPYTFPTQLLYELPRSLARAKKNVLDVQQLVETVEPSLEQFGLRLWSGKIQDRPSWHRVPIYLERESPCWHALNVLAQRNEWAQFPHPTRTSHLKRFSTHRYPMTSIEEGYVILIRPAFFRNFFDWIKNEFGMNTSP